MNPETSNKIVRCTHLGYASQNADYYLLPLNKNENPDKTHIMLCASCVEMMVGNYIGESIKRGVEKGVRFKL